MKKILTILLSLVLAASLIGCGRSDDAPLSDPAAALTEDAAESGGSHAQAEAVTSADEGKAADEALPDEEDGIVRFTMYFVDPATSPYVEGGEKIAQLVSEATDGQIEISVVAGSEMGERELVEAAMDNRLDIATCANSVLTNYIPQMNILDQAYLWHNAEEAHAAVDGELGELIRERTDSLGLHLLGFEESGFRNTFSTKPITKMEDFEGITIRTMENKYHQAAFEAFGAVPKAMPYPEVMGALESGEINACENATSNCLNSGYYQVTKYVTNTEHAFVYILLLMSDDAWARIPEELQTPFLEAVQKGVEWERAHLIQENEEVTEQLTALGVSFCDIDTDALKDAYEKVAAERGFVFDPAWEAAVRRAIEETSGTVP